MNNMTKLKEDNFSIMTDFENLFKAHLKCRKGKRWKDSAANYDIRALECTLALKELLESGRYKISPYNTFVVQARGKTREIKSIKYHDRVVQKVLNDNILEPIVVKKFVNTNCASQKGKGTGFAIANLKKQLRSEVARNGVNSFILVCDMKGYFDSISHTILNEFYARYYKDERIIALIEHIHSSIPEGRGLPLGNQLSQLGALIALNNLDHVIKEKQHIKGYGRYMDDFYLIHPDRDYLRECLMMIREYVETRGMRFNDKKTKIVSLREGFNYLGFKFYVTETGKVVQKVKLDKIKRHKKRLKKMKGLLEEGKITLKDCYEAHRGFINHIKDANTYYLMKKMNKLFYEMFEKFINKEEK